MTADELGMGSKLTMDDLRAGIAALGWDRPHAGGEAPREAVGGGRGACCASDDAAMGAAGITSWRGRLHGVSSQPSAAAALVAPAYCRRR